MPPSHWGGAGRANDFAFAAWIVDLGKNALGILQIKK